MRALIIGAGPAGSCAAILLARAGWVVHLFEQHRFPRKKVCGECLSPLAIEVLDRLNLTRFLRTQNISILRQSTLVAPDGSEATIVLPRPMWGLSRGTLDMALMQAATDSGVIIHSQTRVEKIHSAQQQIIVRDLNTNVLATHSYDYLLVADGKAALALPRPAPTGDLGVKAHFTNVRDVHDAITLFSLPHHYCGLAPIENNLWNIAMSVPADRVRDFGGNLDQLWQHLLSENTGLARRMQSATRATDWLASPLPRFAVRTDWTDQVIPLGNAAAALEPIGGEGIGLALRSAELAAQHLLAPHFDPRALIRAYQKLWTTRRLVCRTGALILSRPTLAHLAVRLLNSNRHIGQTFLSWTGKTAPVRELCR
jgi:2-polyprenyl-6-methoxyphenol hydroxylase-like FAD-dependent oxidoreductase